MKIVLALPPSSNKAYATNWKTGRRFLSKAAKEWIDETVTILKTIKKTFKRATIDLVFYFPDLRRRDTLSFEKLPIDCLVKAGLIADDNWQILPYVSRLAELDKVNPRMEIYIEEIDDPTP